jgi:dihydrofolate reductase
MNDFPSDITAIVAVDKNWAIGNDGGILVHIPGDLKYFKAKTLGGICVMGRKTFESLPSRPLARRVNCVLTRNLNYAKNEAWEADIIVADSVAAIFESLRGLPEAPVFIIGGGTVYREFLPYTRTCLVTKIDAEFKADTFFPNLDNDAEFDLANESDLFTENGVDYRFTEYIRNEK